MTDYLFSQCLNTKKNNKNIQPIKIISEIINPSYIFIVKNSGQFKVLPNNKENKPNIATILINIKFIFYHLFYFTKSFIKKQEIEICNYSVVNSSNQLLSQSQFSEKIVGCSDLSFYTQKIQAPTNTTKNNINKLYYIWEKLVLRDSCILSNFFTGFSHFLFIVTYVTTRGIVLVLGIAHLCCYYFSGIIPRNLLLNQRRGVVA